MIPINFIILSFNKEIHIVKQKNTYKSHLVKIYQVLCN